MNAYNKVGTTRTRSGREVYVFKPAPPSRKDNPVGPLIRGYGGPTPLQPPAGFEELAVQGYALNAVARTAIDKMAGFCASIPLKMQRHDAKGVWSDVDVSEDDESPLMELMAKPNPRQSYVKFIKAIIGFRLLSGSSYIAPNGPSSMLPPTELWTIRPDYMRAVPGVSGLVDVWEFRNGRGMVPFDMRKPSLVKPIMQWSTFNPLSDWYGMPPLRAAGMQLKQHNGGARWNANLMDNGVRPSGMLVVKDATGNGNTTLTEDQREQVLQSYADHMSGPDNAGVPFIAEGGLEWQEMSMNPKDLDWLEGMRDAARLICLVVNIPPLILNIPGDNTFKNYGEAREAAYMDGAIPLMEELVAELNTDLVPAFGDNIRLALDLDKVEALAAWRAERMKNVDLCSFMTTDEKRATVGLDELPDGAGKQVMVSSSMIPLAQAIEPPTPPTNENVDENGDPIPPPVGGKKPLVGKKPAVVPPKKPADGKALETLFKRLSE